MLSCACSTSIAHVHNATTLFSLSMFALLVLWFEHTPAHPLQPSFPGQPVDHMRSRPLPQTQRHRKVLRHQPITQVSPSAQRMRRYQRRSSNRHNACVFLGNVPQSCVLNWQTIALRKRKDYKHDGVPPVKAKYGRKGCAGRTMSQSPYLILDYQAFMI
jgi:hypothetical protein